MGNLALDQELGQEICQNCGLERLLSLLSKSQIQSFYSFAHIYQA